LAVALFDVFLDLIELFIEIDFVEQALHRRGAFAEFGVGVFGEEGGSREEVESLGRVLHLGDEFAGFEIIGAPRFDPFDRGIGGVLSPRKALMASTNSTRAAFSSRKSLYFKTLLVPGFNTIWAAK
jgi:hypothetical protein